MRVWSQGFPGLVLSLAPAWYTLPTHIEGRERARLLELLAAAHADIDHVAELDWPLAEAVRDRLELRRTLVLLRVPASETEGTAPDEVLAAVRNQLGRVRLGLIQHARPDPWPELAWLERQVKSPLLDWLAPQLHDPSHPLAGLDIAQLPLDSLAKVTAEPIELLELLDGVVDRRLRYGEIVAADWTSSVDQVIAERFAARFERVDDESRPAALELVVLRHDDPILERDTLRGPGVALAEAGLAAAWGADVMLGPLAQAAGKRSMLPRLLRPLRASDWSPASRAELTKALPLFVDVPRANLVAPDPPYGRQPALVPEPPAELAEILGQAVDEATIRQWLDERTLPSSPFARLVPELEDRRRMALDVEGGRVARLDALARELGGQGRAWAFSSWLALTYLLELAETKAELELLVAELERVQLQGDEGLAAALVALRGDLAARLGDYALALDSWEAAEAGLGSSLDSARLAFRQFLVLMRLDRYQRGMEAYGRGGEVVQEISDPGAVMDGLMTSMGLLLVQHDWADRLGRFDIGALDKHMLFMRELPSDAAWDRLHRAAACLELGDWPGAFEFVAPLDKSLATAKGRRALLLDATIRAALGERDSAASSFRALLERCASIYDPLVEALAHRGLVNAVEGPDAIRASLARAEAIERLLGLPDANIVVLEGAAWSDRDAILAATTSLAATDGPGAAAAMTKVFLRAIWMAVGGTSGADPDETVLAALAELVGRAPKIQSGAFGPWLHLAIEHLLSLASEQLDADHPDQAQRLLDAIGPLVPPDHRPRFDALYDRTVAPES